ncbi:MAG: hypothetical protein U9M97_03105 [Candidatus Hadarchaeota archaeon]|nr:hypothetical protein [Candidatus Hadarchaeota archaeon]
MKRLFLVTMLVGLLTLGLSVGVAAASVTGTGSSLGVNVTWKVDSWIILYIPTGDMSFDLGEVDSSYYDPVNKTWDPLTDGGSHNAWVITNDPAGYTLTVIAVDASVSGNELADVTRFEMKGGDLSGFTAVDTDQTLKTTSAAAVDHISDIKYRYQVDETDAPGDYAVTVTYTVTTN